MQKRDSWVMGVGMAALAALAAVGAPAQAATELVNNGGFEQGGFGGWVETGDTVFNGVVCLGSDPSAYAGSCVASFGSMDDSGIAQTVNVGAAGLTYNLSFALQSDGTSPSSFSVLFGGQTLLSLTNPTTNGYTLYSFSGLTTAENMTLAFSTTSPFGTLYLDAVSVTAVPEPATMGLMGVGLAGLLLSRRQRGKKALEPVGA